MHLWYANIVCAPSQVLFIYSWVWTQYLLSLPLTAHHKSFQWFPHFTLLCLTDWRLISVPFIVSSVLFQKLKVLWVSFSFRFRNFISSFSILLHYFAVESIFNPTVWFFPLSQVPSYFCFNTHFSELVFSRLVLHSSFFLPKDRFQVLKFSFQPINLFHFSKDEELEDFCWNSASTRIPSFLSHEFYAAIPFVLSVPPSRSGGIESNGIFIYLFVF